MRPNISRRAFGKKVAALFAGTGLLSVQGACTTPPAPMASRDDLARAAREAKVTLLTGESDRREAAEDFGLIVSNEPWAVFKPRSEAEIADLVKLAHRHRLPVAMRGQGHSMFGQAQVRDGVVIDSRGLNSVRMIDFEGARAIEADAGSLWGQVLDLAFTEKRTPPVTVDPLYLSVGGTLSTGGFGATSWRDGFQTDHVLQLQAITGDGSLVTCSDRQNADLFNALLCGMGQCGLITKAVIALTSAPTHVRFFVLSYPSLQAATADITALVKDGRFDHLDGRTAGKDGQFTYNVEAGKFYDASNAPSDDALLAGLQFASRTARVLTYPEYYRRQPPLARGPHPWIYLCLPSSQFIDYAAKVYSTPADFAYSLPRFSPWQRSRIRRPLACLPEQDLVVRFQCSRMPPVSADVQALVATNRSLFERARALGGKRLTTSAIPMTKADWMENFGSAWSELSSAKQKYDPRGILTPGPGIFP